MKLLKTDAQRAKASKAITIAASVMLAVSLMTVTCFADAEAAYQETINFFVTWFRRVGVMVAFVGAIMFGLAIKNDDAERKQSGLITMVAGFVVAALCAAVDMFDLFT